MESKNFNNLTQLLGDQPFAIYPTEVSDNFSFYDLIILAAGMVRTDPALKDVCQFFFITEGGILSKLIQIGEVNSTDAAA